MIALDEAGLSAWGTRLGASLAGGPVVIALRGDLGAGKTTLARAIARGAGVSGSIPSPTYNLLFRYEGRNGRSVAHLDLYRLEKEEDVWALGWSELPGHDELVLIEWPERAESLLPTPRWEVELVESSDQELREVSVVAVGEPPPILLPEVVR
jgi:tRNA threonylcarbamoyladenosine biosynthesis protein TsaE